MLHQKRIVVFVILTLLVTLVIQTDPAVTAQSDTTFVWALVPAGNTTVVLESATTLAKLVSNKTGFTIKPVIAADFAGAVEAMCNGQAQLAALNTFGYILASSRKCADVGLVSVRNQSISYRGQIIARADSGIKKLADLKDKVFCRPDPISTSGWIVPSILLQANRIDPATDLKQVVDAGGHDAVVDFVYNGKCDAGATFEDARSQVEKKYPDVRDKVVVIAYSAPIPNDTVSFVPSMDTQKRAAIVKALLDIAADKANADALKKLASWTGLAEANDAFFDDFRQELDAAGVNIETLLPKKQPATPAATMRAEATMAATVAK